MEDKDLLNEENVNTEAPEAETKEENADVESTTDNAPAEGQEVVEEVMYVDENGNPVDENGNPIEYVEETDERTEEVVLEEEETPEERLKREALEREKEQKEKERKARVDSYLESVFAKDYGDDEEEKTVGVTVADESSALDEDLFLDENEKKAKNKEKKKKEKKDKKLKKKKKEVLFDLDQSHKEEDTHEEVKKEEDDEDKIDPNGLEIVVDRIEHGLIGSLRIEDAINEPMFKKGDICQLRAPSRLQKKDFILYKNGENYFLRRILKFTDAGIYVAGDNEKAYHICAKEDVVGKAIGRQRKKKYYSFAFKNSRVYDFFKVNLANLRLGDRVMDNDADMSLEAYEAAMQAAQASQPQQQEEVKQQVINIDLDSDLASFLDPDELVKELREARELGAEDVESPREIYVDEDGNPITEEEYLAALAAADSEENQESDESATDENAQESEDEESTTESDSENKEETEE